MLAFFSSPVAISALIAWVLAQTLKVPIEYIRHHKWQWGYLIDPGHMPSSHSAIMTAATTSIGITEGWSSAVFVLALCVTSITIYDATGVRRQSGFHAERINLLFNKLKKMEKWDEEDRKSLAEVIGHTPMEALAGALFGIAIAVIVCILMGAL